MAKTQGNAVGSSSLPGAELPLVTHSWLPTYSLYSHSEEERMEDTSRDNGDTGVQGHQSAGAKIKAIPLPLPAQTCHQILEEGVSLSSQYFFLHFSPFKNKSAGRTKFSRMEKSNLLVQTLVITGLWAPSDFRSFSF